MRLYYGERRTAIEVSLRMIPAHGKHEMVTQSLLMDVRCVGEGMRHYASFLSFLAKFH